MRKWLLVALVALVLLVVMAYVMGSRLPVDHVATVRAHYRAQPESVYAAVRDVEGYPKWRTDVKKVEVLPPQGGRPRWRETSGHGTLEYEFTLDLPPNRLVSTLETRDAGFSGRWMFHFLRDTSGTDVMITEEGAVPNPLFRFMMQYIFGPYSTLETYLRMLGNRFGETIQPVRVS
jgi:uncharacterized protein YndB with AHSA1/START domain